MRKITFLSLLALSIGKFDFKEVTFLNVDLVIQSHKPVWQLDKQHICECLIYKIFK